MLCVKATHTEYIDSAYANSYNNSETYHARTYKNLAGLLQ
jgi:hypothetical protein